MKKTLLLSTLICFFAVSIKAQPMTMVNIFYGNYIVTQDSSYRLSCGISTKIKQGYVSFGFNQSVSTSTLSWWCSKNFMITGYGNSFIWRGFDIYDATNCSGTLSKVNHCNGITAVEVNGPSKERYAIAGTYDKAVFFTTIDSIGNVIAYNSYPFPPASGSTFSKPSKPVIIKSDILDEYYICGNFESKMYILNVNASGSVIWSSFYTLGNVMTAKDIMMDPYQSHRLIVVGSALTPNMDVDAFFMNIDASSGAFGTTKLFGSGFNVDEFRSVIPASYISPNNGSGYIVSGYAQNTNASGGTAWVMKLDHNGNIIWNKLITPSTGTNVGCVDIIERLNTMNNFEYYALIEGTAGMQVAKLDDTGLPFEYYLPNGVNNEFIYNISSPVSKPVSLGYINSSSMANFTGLQVYGTMFTYNTNVNINGSYVVGAYFNGETNCYGTTARLSSCNEGPAGIIGDLAMSRFGSLDTCRAFLVTSSFGGIISAYQCGNIIPSGSNQRSAASGELLKFTQEEKLTGIFPNPVITKTSVTYTSSDNSKVSIHLFDVVGKHILSLQPEARMAGVYSEEIDFSNLGIESGVYFLTVSVDGITTKEKIVYNK